jgi:hypothetical protein
MRKAQHADEKAMLEIAQANKKLAEPLKQNQKLIEELSIELKNYQKDKLLLKQTKDRVDVIEQNMKKLDWEHEITQQKYTKFKEERDLLFQQLENSVYDQQQKSGFKRLLLEKHLEAVHDTLEKKEVALHEVAVSTNLRPEVCQPMLLSSFCFCWFHGFNPFFVGLFRLLVACRAVWSKCCWTRTRSPPTSRSNSKNGDRRITTSFAPTKRSSTSLVSRPRNSDLNRVRFDVSKALFYVHTKYLSPQFTLTLL